MKTWTSLRLGILLGLFFGLAGSLHAAATTTIRVAGAGGLIVEDTDGSDTDDDLTFSLGGGTLDVVENNGNAIKLDGVPGTGDGTASVSISLSSFAWSSERIRVAFCAGKLMARNCCL